MFLSSILYHDVAWALRPSAARISNGTEGAEKSQVAQPERIQSKLVAQIPEGSKIIKKYGRTLAISSKAQHKLFPQKPSIN